MSGRDPREELADVLAATRRYLERDGHEVRVVGDGNEALRVLSSERIDVAVLDVMMPFADGLTVCREARHRGIQTPILLLTARAEVGDRVAGLDAGADDYLVKPFVVDELLARCRALLRRTAPSSAQSILKVGDLILNSLSREVHRGERELVLTKTEFDLLELLMQQPNAVVSRDYIYEAIWGYDFETSSKSLDVYIGYLRRKTEENGESRVVFTVRGVGYTVKES